MKLSKFERLILSNQLRILEKLYPEEADQIAAHRSAIEGGFALHYNDSVEYFSSELSEDDCKEVIDILNMHSALFFSYEKLDDKSGIEPHEIEFRGFDGNDPGESRRMSYVKYLLHDLDRFEELHKKEKHPRYNSHTLMLHRYQEMLAEWENCDDKYNLGKEDIRRIINSSKRLF